MVWVAHRCSGVCWRSCLLGVLDYKDFMKKMENSNR